MNGTAQALLFVAGVILVGIGLVELTLTVAGALVGLAFPLLIGAALVVPAVSARKKRKALR